MRQNVGVPEKLAGLCGDVHHPLLGFVPAIWSATPKIYVLDGVNHPLESYAGMHGEKKRKRSNRLPG